MIVHEEKDIGILTFTAGNFCLAFLIHGSGTKLKDSTKCSGYCPNTPKTPIDHSPPPPTVLSLRSETSTGASLAAPLLLLSLFTHFPHPSNGEHSPGSPKIMLTFNSLKSYLTNSVVLLVRYGYCKIRVEKDFLRMRWCCSQGGTIQFGTIAHSVSNQQPLSCPLSTNHETIIRLNWTDVTDACILIDVGTVN